LDAPRNIPAVTLNRRYRCPELADRLESLINDEVDLDADASDDSLYRFVVVEDPMEHE